METEYIRAITETIENADSWSGEEGFKIITNKQEILLLIDNGQSCCEQWGYFLTEQDTEKFIGAEVLAVEITDVDRSTIEQWNKSAGWASGAEDIYEGSVMFVDIKTSEGTLQFVAYNSHNGYYGHSARVVSSQLNHQTVL